MLQEIRREAGWTCFADPNAAHDIANYISSVDSLSEMLGRIIKLPTTFKDNHRSRVLSNVNSSDELGVHPIDAALFPSSVFAHRIVAKQPRNKNQSLVSRIFSLFRNGEARQAFLALERFKALNIKAGEPLLVLEKCQFGMIVDSWVVYEYLVGEPATPEQVPQIIRLLNKIHDAGFEHKDPTLSNFYLDKKGGLFIIDCVLRPSLGNFSRCRDLSMLAANNPSVSVTDVAPALAPYQSTLGAAVYALYRRYRKLREAVKYALRGRKPKNH